MVRIDFSLVDTNSINERACAAHGKKIAVITLPSASSALSEFAAIATDIFPGGMICPN
jgi:hypothetical protein